VQQKIAGPVQNEQMLSMLYSIATPRKLEFRGLDGAHVRSRISLQADGVHSWGLGAVCAFQATFIFSLLVELKVTIPCSLREAVKAQVIIAGAAGGACKECD
jgi:hypothetical protein